jgi:beta-glucosidase
MINRRSMLVAAAAAAFATRRAAAAAAAAGPAAGRQFPKGFLWGTATAGHQVEGNNINSDIWLLEQVKPTIYAEPSGDATNSFELWAQDLDLVRSFGLNCYRFSLEWARIEPEPGQYSIAMLNHYRAIIDGCRARGLSPMVTFNHFTAPRWFAARGGWTNPRAPELFAAYCRRAAEHLAAGIAHATTFNEPNLLRLLKVAGFPPALFELQRGMLAAAGRASGSDHYVTMSSVNAEDLGIDRGRRCHAADHRRGAPRGARGDQVSAPGPAGRRKPRDER